MTSPHFLSTPEQIVAEAANGRMFILVDDEGRENEGDLVIPAQMATPGAISFMASYGRGLICLAMTAERAQALQLSLQHQRGISQHETAFTVSIEACDGVTTGISAADRARTISVAINAAHGPEAIVTPGHVFPLIARDGGVLVRAGHTEAAVDVARLAGLNPSGVICEIMNEDGSMARRDDLIAFANRHGLKIGAIRDLIAFRRRHDRHVEKRAEYAFHSKWGGTWSVHTYWNSATSSEQIAIVKGEINPRTPVMVRMHRMSHLTDIFAEESPRSNLLRGAMEMIAANGSGAVVLLNRPLQGDTFGKLLNARGGGEAVGSISERPDIRDYGGGAQILSELGVQQIILLSNTPTTMVALAGYGLEVVETRHIPDTSLD